MEIVHGIDPRPAVVVGIRICVAPADLYAAFVQAVVYETGTIERIRTFVAEHIGIAELILCAFDDSVDAVFIA